MLGEIHSAGEVLPLSFPVDSEMVFTSGFGSALTFPRLEVGEEVRLDSFDLLTLRKSPARVRCVARETLQVMGETLRTRRLLVRSSGIESRVWIDDADEVVRAETQLGWILERIRPPAAERAPADLAEQPPAGDELGGFYYHAWPEVHVGGWIWMDPTLDQTVADATHVKLLNGGIESWPQLLPFLGRLRIDVLEIE